MRRVKFCCTAAVCRDCTLLYPQLVPHEPARLGARTAFNIEIRVRAVFVASVSHRRSTKTQSATGGRSVRLRALVIVVTLLAELSRAGSVWAQGPRGFSDGVDFEPPLIEHEEIREADAAFRQRFVAQVVDDRELASVTLNWRFRGESEYTRTAMSRVSSSSTWTGQVPTSPSESRSIEYFIEARDVGGNRTVRGFVFNPLVRRIINVEPTNVPVVAEKEPAAPASKTIYYVLGALALGIIAGAASSRSSGGTDNGECGAEGCSVVIRFEPPVTQ